MFCAGLVVSKPDLFMPRSWLAPIKKKYPGLSYGDLYTLAGVTAVEKMGGPTIK